MAERKATNKYYPPDWDPACGSVNKHRKSHPLRDRAKKLDQGILVVRFEMPYSIWCLKCNNHIGMGVRYNAEKSKVGNYYSTPIYKFKMKCHLCDNYFDIQTDPAKFDYVIVSGARKQVRMGDDERESKEPSTSNAIGHDGHEIEERKVTDAMSRLERRIEDKISAESQIPGLHELKESRTKWKDSFAANQLIRRQFRERRRKLEQQREKDKKLLKKSSLNISLRKSNRPEDSLMAKKILLEASTPRLTEREKSKKRTILNSKIIAKKKVRVKEEPTA